MDFNFQQSARVDAPERPKTRRRVNWEVERDALMEQASTRTKLQLFRELEKEGETESGASGSPLLYRHASEKRKLPF